MAIQDNQVKLDIAKKELAECKEILEGRVDSIYRGGNMDFILVILGAKDFENFLSRLSYMRKICEKDAKVLEDVEQLKKEMEIRDQQLIESKAQQRIVLNKIDAEKTSLESALKEKQAILGSINADIRKLEEEEKRRVEAERRRALENSKKNPGNSGGGGNSAYLPDSSFRFPVAHPYSYCDSWHAPRSGGRVHLGCDIFALRGTHALACVNGRVLRMSNGGLGGIGITLQDKSGNTYYYGHLDGYASGIYTGMQVTAGQLIGYVGDTGNAKGTPPHVHFEIHPGGGSAINPYPILKLVG